MTKVLLVDSYDSYTFNLHQLLLNVIPEAEIVIVRNDQFVENDLHDLVRAFDFIVIGPGPGDPRNAGDVGFLPKLFEYNVPILGVCLGFQLLCMYAGATIERLNTVKHGQVSELHTRECNIYPRGLKFNVTRYHSLYACNLNTNMMTEIGWVKDEYDNGHVAMAVKCKDKPFVGVQYHPESACSDNGEALIANFIHLAESWNKQHRPSIPSVLTNTHKNHNIRPEALTKGKLATGKVEWRELGYTVPTDLIAELLGVREKSQFILLDAAAEPSRYSVLAVLSGEEDRLQYSVGQPTWQFGQSTMSPTQESPTVWHFIASLMQNRKVQYGPLTSPFWGGLAGYLSYESGVESLSIEPLAGNDDEQDISLIFVERSIVFDHDTRKTYVQSIKNCIRPDKVSDQPWIELTCQMMDEALRTPPPSPPGHLATRSVDVELPDKVKYVENIQKAQEYLAEGQSYELCLTARTKITCERRHPWDIYRSLRSRNPSPFAAYMKLDGIHLLSSSPERFLSWTRDGHCQLRPIKGTVRKSPGVTLERAVEILRDPKEVAENLMIVDLIRHDLHQIATNVQVPQLMQVEEYHTVYQLVSVITGQYDPPYTGFDILSRSLPPGSMTGAPKKRSVELLQKLEGRPRRLYSGVAGYLSVCGGGDWSVIIRSAFRHASDNQSPESSESDVWYIGAGGAITALSDPEAEWQEMLTKLQSTLPCFGYKEPLT